MKLRILSIEHRRHGLREVERAAANAGRFRDLLLALDGVHGVVTLSTCNRVELMIDATHIPSTTLLQGLRDAEADLAWEIHEVDGALRHLFRVAAGLESMVVGEREIAHQLRRALNEAQDSGKASPMLVMCIEEALRTSRRIARETRLHSAGRSVVSEGLDMLGALDWPDKRILIVGTGAFAGAVVSAVRSRGAHDLRVHSPSGRGGSFAHSHGLREAPGLLAAVRSADVVISCRGQDEFTLGIEAFAGAGEVAVLDLALGRDVDPEVDELPGVHVVDLARIHRHVAPKWDADTRHADAVVEDGVKTALSRDRSRIIDPVVVELRQTVLDLVADEVSRLPQDRDLDRDECAQALRRLAARILHTPSVRAREAAEADRVDEFINAMRKVHGIGDLPVAGSLEQPVDNLGTRPN